MKRIALIATLVAVGSISFAQTRVWSSVTDQATNSYGPCGTTAANGYGFQAGEAQWTQWPERGSGIDFGSSQVLTEMSFYYLANTSDVMTGNEVVTITIYANDGGAVTGTGGSPLNAPNTVLFTSSPIKVYPGDQSVRIPLPNLAVPGKITVTQRFTGGNFDGAQGSFDPTLSLDIPGGRFWCGASSSQLQGTKGGVMWRRVFTPTPSAWAGQDNPGVAGGFPGTFCFGMNFWSGNTALLTNPYDNGTNVIGQGGFQALGDPVGTTAPAARAGDQISLSGPNNKITSIDFGYYADTTASVGSPTYTLKLVNQDKTDFWLGGIGGTPDDSAVLWSSGPQAIPLGQGGGGSGALQTATLTVPGITIPSTCYWVMEVAGLSGNDDDIVGPGVIWSPNPGDSPNFVALDLGSGWGEYVYGTGTGTFIYTTIADFGPITIHGTAASSTETLAPTSFSVGTSKQQSGNLASLAADDNNALVVCKFLVPNQTDIIKVTFNFTTTKSTPTAVQLVSKAKMVAGGVFQYRAFQHNFAGNVDDQLGADVAITAGYNTFTNNASGTLTNYVGAANAMQSKTLIRQTGPSVAAVPCVSYEFVNLKVTG